MGYTSPMDLMGCLEFYGTPLFAGCREAVAHMSLGGVVVVRVAGLEKHGFPKNPKDLNWNQPRRSMHGIFTFIYHTNHTKSTKFNPTIPVPWMVCVWSICWSGKELVRRHAFELVEKELEPGAQAGVETDHRKPTIRWLEVAWTGEETTMVTWWNRLPGDREVTYPSLGNGQMINSKVPNAKGYAIVPRNPPDLPDSYRSSGIYPNIPNCKGNLYSPEGIWRYSCETKPLWAKHFFVSL